MVSDEDPRGVLVYTGVAYKPFGAFTAADARDRAEELRASTGWGPTARVGSVARGWSELATVMARSGAETVADLDAEQIAQFAVRVWVTPRLL